MAWMKAKAFLDISTHIHATVALGAAAMVASTAGIVAVIKSEDTAREQSALKFTYYQVQFTYYQVLGCVLATSCVFVWSSWPDFCGMWTWLQEQWKRVDLKRKDEASTKVEKMLSELRLERAESAITYCGELLLLGNLSWLLYLSIGGDATDSSFMVFLLLEYMVVTVLKVLVTRAQVISVSNIHIFMFFPVHVILLARVLFFSDAKTWFLNSAIRALDLALLAGVEINFKHTMAWALLHFAASGFKTLELGKVISVQLFDIYSSLYAEFATAMLVAGLGFLIEVCDRHRMHAIVKLEESLHEQSSTRKLLSVFCDGLVHLSSDLCMQKPDSRVQHILQPHSASASLDGADFTTFVADSDRIRFVSLINPAIPRDDNALLQPPSSLHLQLRHATGSLFQAQIFHVLAPSLSGESGHLIGIVDNSRRTLDTLEPSKSAFPIMTRRRKTPSESSKASSSGSSGSSGSSRSRRKGQEKGMVLNLLKCMQNVTNVSVVCDPFTNEFRLTHLDMDFAVAGPDLQSWFGAKQWENFRDWVRGNLSDVLAGNKEQSNFKNAKLTMVPGCSLKSQCVEIIVIDSEVQESGSDDSEDFTLCLAFKELSLCKAEVKDARGLSTIEESSFSP